jgi:hypothetical protein
MSRYTEILRIPIEDIAILADVYEGYAFSLEESLSEERFLEIQPWRSSSLLLAAIFKSLLNPYESKVLFREAALNYQAIGNQFWKILAICALDREILLTQQALPIEDRSEVDETSYFYNLLSQCWLSSFDENQFHNSFPNYLQQAQGESLQKVGRLEIPIRLFTRTMIDSLEWRSSQPKLQNWRTLLDRANESVEISKSDRFHWERLPGSIVPLEPEILAVCISLGSRWLSMNHSLEELRERINIEGSTAVPLLIAIEMLEEFRNPNF